MKNYYKVLGVPQSASADEIKKAYKVLAQQYNPDKNRGDKYAEERFIDISVAYKTLTDIEKRKDYDRILTDILIEIDTDTLVDQQTKKVTSSTRKPWPVYFISVFFLIIIVAVVIMQMGSDVEDAVLPVAPIVDSSAQVVVPKDTQVIAVAAADTIVKQAERTKDTITKVKKQETTIVKNTDSTRQKKIDEKPQKDTIVKAKVDIVTVGATKKSVLAIQGTPSSITSYGNNKEAWHYGGSTIFFVDGKIASYKNVGNSLKLE